MGVVRAWGKVGVVRAWGKVGVVRWRQALGKLGLGHGECGEVKTGLGKVGETGLGQGGKRPASLSISYMLAD